MKKLLQFEFRKLFRQTSLYVCLAVAILLVLLNESIPLIMESFTQSSGNVEVSGIVISTEYFGIKSLLAGLMECSFELLAAILVSINVCSDYTQNTIRTVITKGYTKTQIFIAKYIVNAVQCLLLLFASSLTAFIFGTIAGSVGEFEIGNFLLLYLSQILVVIGYTSFFFLIAILLRKNAASIALGIIIPTFSSIGIAVGSLLLNHYGIEDFEFSNVFISSHINTTSTYLSNFDDLMTVFTSAAIVSVIYLFVDLLLGWFCTRNREV